MGQEQGTLDINMEQKCAKVKGKNRSTENRSDPPLPQMPPHLDPRTTATSTFLSLGHEFEKGTDLLDLLKPAHLREAGRFGGNESVSVYTVSGYLALPRNCEKVQFIVIETQTD